MTQTKAAPAGQAWAEPKPTALLVLADGTVLEGFGLGATGHAVGEVCFNTAMTGYEEILTDPSYAGQIITFTFPHIGNVGTNEEDIETVNMAATPGARGVILHTAITAPSNYRATEHLNDWLKARGIVGLAGIDTRALTALIRVKGMPNAVIAHEPTASSISPRSKKEAQGMAGPRRHGPGADGDERPALHLGRDAVGLGQGLSAGRPIREFHVVAIDYGIKRNILRLLAGTGCKVTVVPAKTSAEDIMALKPDGVFLSNGPGDPAATGEYAVPVIRKLIDSGTPTFGICLGHQMLGIAVGGKTMKMHQGHHGANHPVKDLDHRQGRDHLDEPRLRGRQGIAAEECRADARLAVRRLQLRHRAEGQAGVLGAVPSRGFAGPARQPLSLHALRRDDAAGQAQDCVEAQDVTSSHPSCAAYAGHPDSRIRRARKPWIRPADQSRP